MDPIQEVFQQLRTACVPDIDPADRELIRRHLAGVTLDELAASTNMSRATVARHMDTVLVKAFARAGVARSPWLEGIWIFLQLDCCLALPGPAATRRRRR